PLLCSVVEEDKDLKGEMVQRLVYRSRHSYATKSNQHRIVKTPGGKLTYQTTKKRASGPKCPVTGKRIQGIPHLRPAEYKRSRLSRNRRTVNRAYGGVLSALAVRERIVRAFLVEEQKIVKKVLKLQKAKEKVISIAMVRDRNAEHVLAEKGSSSHPKRQPLSSLVEDEAEPVQEAEGGENGEEGTVSCIAPCAPGVSEFSFQLSYSSYFACRTMSFGLSEMSRIQKVSFQTPEKDFMFVIESVISIAMWNAEQVISGGASSSSYSVFGEETDTEAGDDEVTVTEEVRSGTLFELDLLDCPVCCHALTRPCDNGHIACSSCCTNLRSKCPSCTLPIGVYRNRMMERVVEAVIVPCPNAKHGCTEMFSYGKELVHEKECSFALCYCPRRGCNYAGLCKDLYRHYYNCSSAREYFRCGYNVQAWMHIRDKILVLQEGREGPLVAIQCFEEEQGVYVTVNCIAPCVPGVSEFSFQLSYSSYGGADKTMSFGLGEMNRIQKVCFQTPDKDFMFVPHYFLAGRTSLKMNICEKIKRRMSRERGRSMIV
ncbi:hypothetical protein HID58_027476, partial [Brassica napus]